MPVTCALCMIVKNEEEVLARCLTSALGLFDELVIVDTGSIDNTISIAQRFTDKIYHFDWRDDFSAARNYAFSLASTDYAMWLDADDVIPESSRQPLKRIISSLDKERPDMVYLSYCVGLDESKTPSLSFQRERIIRLRSGLKFEGRIHEAIPPRGKVIKDNSASIWHMGKSKREEGRNLRIFESMITSGEKLSMREEYYYARELSYAKRVEEAKKHYLTCIESDRTWVENKISAMCELSQLYLKENDPESAASLLLGTLKYQPPRSDMCCLLGQALEKKGLTSAAEFWYALAPIRYENSGASFIPADWGGYIPYLSLCVLYDKKGDYAAASRFNELAGEKKPNGVEYLKNKAYFETKLNSIQTE